MFRRIAVAALLAFGVLTTGIMGIAFAQAQPNPTQQQIAVSQEPLPGCSGSPWSARTTPAINYRASPG